MKRMLSVLLVGLALLMAVTTVSAQVGAKAYAPEDLRSLSQNDQARVIGLEYADQSRGRRIPDDQLRFYLDQVNRSNWGFSRIKQDIASSLGGRPDAWSPGPGLPGPAGSVLCESDNNRYRECRTGFRGRAVLTRNLSQTRCIEGQNWGSGNGVVWVDRGCKGRFVPASGNGAGPGAGATIRCESIGGRTQTCETGFRGAAVLSRQLSSTRCVANQNWGQRRGSIWVSGGCRGEFRAAGGGWNQGPGDIGDYSVTCNSSDQRRATCAWNDRRRPVLIQQLSSDACREGYSWGYTRNAIWVDRGCRARFGIRR